MRRSSARLWSELRKELSRSSNLVWLAALLTWLALSSSRYSHWHSLSHHLLRNKWLSPMQINHQLHNPHAQHMFLPSLASSTSWAHLHQLNFTHTEMDSTKKSALISDRQDGLNVSIEADDDIDNDAPYVHGLPQEDGLNVSIEADDDNDNDAHYVHDLHQEDELITLDGDSHFAHREDGFNQSIMIDDDAHHVHSPDPNENAQENQDHGDSGGIETLEEGTSLAGTSYQSPYEVQHEPPKTCASVEEMGFVAAGTVVDSSLRVRKMINDYFSEHGASYVRDLPKEEFCHRSFVFGRAAEDGLGNDIYKILTASGLSIMLNRSLIIAEHGSTNPAYFGLTGRVRLPFGDYLRYSNQTFSLSEVKRLWVKHDCAGVFQRPLTMIIDDFQRPTQTKVFCEDWTRWHHPII